MADSPLISADAARDLLKQGDRLIVLDARPDHKSWEEGHLPGAIHVELNRDLSDACEPGFDPARGGRHPLPSIDRWAATLGAWGIGRETPVLVYDASDASNAASRLWWMLRASGHRDVRVLDGGFAEALERGLPVTRSGHRPPPRPPYPVDRWQLPVVDLSEVDALRTDPDWKVLDVRSTPRYRGETEPIDPVAGHIPGAINLPFANNMDGSRFKSPEALRDQYRDLLGNTPVNRLVVHCGSGVTACHTLLALSAAGLEGASLYVGSWSEWCRNPMPVGTSQ